MEKKLKIYQMWSVWAAGLLGILTALEPFWPALQKASPPAWQSYIAVAIIVLRAIKQKPPGPPSSGAGIAAAGLLIFASGCGMTAAEKSCVAKIELEESPALTECIARGCSDAEIDAIMEPNDEREKQCLKAH